MARTIAVLAVQGAFAEHKVRLRQLGANVVELRQAGDLEQEFDGLILPGGESTTQAKLLRELGMFDELKSRIEAGLPVLATCAGLILLAKSVQGTGDLAHLDPTAAEKRLVVKGLGTLDVTVERNAYGRQLGSFHAHAPLAGREDEVPLTFIRAPKITQIGSGVETLIEYDGTPVAVRQGKQIAVAFHPELDPDTSLHELFLSL